MSGCDTPWCFDTRLSATTLDAVPLFLLRAHIKCPAAQWCRMTVMRSEMRTVALVGIVARERAQDTPPLCDTLAHVGTSTIMVAARTLAPGPLDSYGASDEGNTGNLRSTREQTRNMSRITIHSTAAKNTVITASSR